MKHTRFILDLIDVLSTYTESVTVKKNPDNEYGEIEIWSTPRFEPVLSISQEKTTAKFEVNQLKIRVSFLGMMEHLSIERIEATESHIRIVSIDNTNSEMGRVTNWLTYEDFGYDEHTREMSTMPYETFEEVTARCAG